MPDRFAQDIEQALLTFPWMDPHTHLDAGRLTARGLDDILLCHMAMSDLYAAGCPNGARVPEERTEEQARKRIVQSMPFLENTRNTFLSWGVRIILEGLYGWTDPVNVLTWARLHLRIAERSHDKAWAREIVKKTNIARMGTELWRGRDGSADDLFQYALEWGFFSRCQWGVYDTPLIELERAWNEPEPGRAMAVSHAGGAPEFEKTITAPDDVHQAITHYCELIPVDRVLAMATHISTDIAYGNPSEADMAEAIANRPNATAHEQSVYASYITRRLLDEMDRRNMNIVFQFSLGAEPLPFETASRVNQDTLRQVGELVAAYPNQRFMCFLGSRHANQTLCTLARELPNLSLAGYWWHNFFPGAMKQVMEERLDMLPMNKQIGFLSDAYCLEWTYAKAVMTRKLLAEVFAGKCALGQYTLDDCAVIGKGILYDSSVNLLGMAPAQ